MTEANGVARDQLRAFVERIERLEEEKKSIADDIKDVYGEAKSFGFDTKILKMVISLRKKDEQQRTEEEIILDTYLQALGMIPAFEREEGTKSEAKASGEQTEGTPGHQGAGPRREMRVGAASAVLPATSEFTDVTAGETATNSAAASQGEADAPSDERVTPHRSGSAAADIGGDHVTETPHFAAIRPGLVSNSPANHPLRPNCKNPGSECAGYGSKLCHACAVAVRELETT